MLSNIERLKQNGSLQGYCELFGADERLVSKMVDDILTTPLKEENKRTATARLVKLASYQELNTSDYQQRSEVDIIQSSLITELGKPMGSNDTAFAVLAFIVALTSENEFSLPAISDIAGDNWKHIESAMAYGVSRDFNIVPENLKFDMLSIALQNLPPEEIYRRIFINPDLMEIIKNDTVLINQLFESINKSPASFIHSEQELISVISMAIANNINLNLGGNKFVIAEYILIAHEIANTDDKETLKQFYNKHICTGATINDKCVKAVSELDQNFNRYANLLENSWNNEVTYDDSIKSGLLECLDFNSMLALRSIDTKVNGHKARDFLDLILDSFTQWVASVIGSDKKVFDAFKSNIVGPLKESLGDSTIMKIANESGVSKPETEKLVEKLATIGKSQVGREL
jgi:hypothetical protein